jgi:hypothetical protein
MKILDFFYFCGSFLPSWIRIRNLNADPDTDPAPQINADPCGSGSGYGSVSETLVSATHLVTPSLLGEVGMTFFITILVFGTREGGR